MKVLETDNLGKRYRSTWALADCSVSVPSGHIVALVGPNGAGKTTLLNCAVGLVTPTVGRVHVLGRLSPGSRDALQRIAYVAQDAPLFKQLSANDMINVARSLNVSFDEVQARRRLDDLGIQSEVRVGRLSGGQQAQLALTLALSRHPDLLILDEPVARLDPVARHDFLTLVVAAAAEEGLSVIFSSHVISELERIADYVLLLSKGRVELAQPIDQLLSEHMYLCGPTADTDIIRRSCVILEATLGSRQARLLVKERTHRSEIPRGWEAENVGLEDLILAYLRGPAPALTLNNKGMLEGAAQ
jgi:ABC-2 type transport system ATP-binding protein